MTSWISHSGAPGWIIAMTDSDGLQCLSEFFPSHCLEVEVEMEWYLLLLLLAPD